MKLNLLPLGVAGLLSLFCQNTYAVQLNVDDDRKSIIITPVTIFDVFLGRSPMGFHHQCYCSKR